MIKIHLKNGCIMRLEKQRILRFAQVKTRREVYEMLGLELEGYSFNAWCSTLRHNRLLDAFVASERRRNHLTLNTKKAGVITIEKAEIHAVAAKKTRNEVYLDYGLNDKGYTFSSWCNLIRNNDLGGCFKQSRRHTEHEKARIEHCKGVGMKKIKVKCYNAPACRHTIEIEVAEDDTRVSPHRLCHKCKAHGHPSERSGYDIQAPPYDPNRTRYKVKRYQGEEIERIADEITPLDQCRVAGTMTYPGESSFGGPRANRT